jgi:hypothetical protein
MGSLAKPSPRKEIGMADVLGYVVIERTEFTNFTPWVLDKEIQTEDKARGYAVLAKMLAAQVKPNSTYTIAEVREIEAEETPEKIELLATNAMNLSRSCVTILDVRELDEIKAEDGGA